jgi:hypothetical protein
MKKEQEFDCSDLERALREDTPELRAALESHAADCSACSEELRIWREISAAAQTMRKDWPTGALWPRIERALETEPAKPRGWRIWISGMRLAPSQSWQTAFAALALLAVSGTGAWLLLHQSIPAPVADQHLLTDQAVRQVEQAEQTYEQSIEKLAKLADPKLASASTPLLVNYREKLDLLDAAIADCRVNLDKNRANAHLREELLSFYQEKERTLEQVLQEE